MSQIGLQRPYHGRWPLSFWNQGWRAWGWVWALGLMGWLALVPALATAQGVPTPLVIDPAAAHIDLGPAVHLLEDPQGTLTMDDVLRPEHAGRFKRGSPNVGRTTAAVWLRFSVQAAATPPPTWWLDTGNRTLQEVSLFTPRSDGGYQRVDTGSVQRFDQRPLPTTTFVFPWAPQTPKAQDVFIRVRTTGYLGIVMAPALWQPEAYRTYEQREVMLWTFMLGLALALAVLNLLLAAYNRDANNLLYVLSLASITLCICCGAGGYGAAYQYFWPHAPVFQQVMWVGSIGLAATLPNVLVWSLLKLHTVFRRFTRFMAPALGIYVAWTLLQVTLTALQRESLTAFLQLSWDIGAAICCVPMLMTVFATGLQVWRGDRTARLVALAFIPLLATGMYASYFTVVYGQMPWMPLLVAVGFEWFVMAIAVADRYYQVRQERAQARRELLDGLQKSERELESKVVLRTQELSAQQQRTQELLAKNQDLLHNILPADIARELTHTGTTTPVRHESASVLFTDFAGFTQAASTMPAGRMVAELSEVFAAFDDICDEEGVEKIKTIGDAYMATAGLPTPSADHAQRCVRAGLRMAAFVEQRNADSAFKWRLRVGIHSGPVIAGVVGKRKYAFDIWGDTVNIASRMESAGEPGRVNVSAYTYDLIRKDFGCDYRGKLDAKGKGDVDMYFVKESKL